MAWTAAGSCVTDPPGPNRLMAPAGGAAVLADADGEDGIVSPFWAPDRTAMTRYW